MPVPVLHDLPRVSLTVFLPHWLAFYPHSRPSLLPPRRLVLTPSALNVPLPHIPMPAPSCWSGLSLYSNITAPKGISLNMLTSTQHSPALHFALFFFIALITYFVYLFIVLSLTSSLEGKFHEDRAFCFTHSCIPKPLSTELTNFLNPHLIFFLLVPLF